LYEGEEKFRQGYGGEKGYWEDIGEKRRIIFKCTLGIPNRNLFIRFISNITHVIGGIL
jgi:hypothetical protein